MKSEKLASGRNTSEHLGHSEEFICSEGVYPDNALHSRYCPKAAACGGILRTRAQPKRAAA